MSYQLLANGIISPPHTQSRTCNTTVKSSTEQSDKPIFKTSKECSLSTNKECSLSSTKECSLSSNKECSLATSHFSVGEKVRLRTEIFISQPMY